MIGSSDDQQFENGLDLRLGKPVEEAENIPLPKPRKPRPDDPGPADNPAVPETGRFGQYIWAANVPPSSNVSGAMQPDRASAGNLKAWEGSMEDEHRDTSKEHTDWVEGSETGTLPHPDTQAGFQNPNIPHITINRDHDVKSASVASKDPNNNTVYIDPSIPDRFAPFLAVHEETEKRLMADGLSYDKAHIHATLAERHAVVASGQNWDTYTDEIDPYVAKTEKGSGKNPPPDPHVNIEDSIGHHADKASVLEKADMKIASDADERPQAGQKYAMEDKFRRTPEAFQGPGRPTEGGVARPGATSQETFSNLANRGSGRVPLVNDPATGRTTNWDAVLQENQRSMQQMIQRLEAVEARVNPRTNPIARTPDLSMSPDTDVHNLTSRLDRLSEPPGVSQDRATSQQAQDPNPYVIQETREIFDRALRETGDIHAAHDAAAAFMTSGDDFDAAVDRHISTPTPEERGRLSQTSLGRAHLDFQDIHNRLRLDNPDLPDLPESLRRTPSTPRETIPTPYRRSLLSKLPTPDKLDMVREKDFGIGTNRHKFNFIDEDGVKRGTLRVAEEQGGKNIHVDMVEGWGSGGPGAFGPKVMRDILKQIKDTFPKAETLEGFRVSGARKKADKLGVASIRLRKAAEE